MLTYKRGKRKIIADYKFDEIYNFYQEQYGEKALPRDVVRKIYSKIFPGIVKLMVFETLDFRMPAHLGYLRVKKKEVTPKIDVSGELDTRKLSVNWKKTKKLWQDIYPDKTAEEIKDIEGKPVVRELNDHSDNYRMSWFWDKSTCKVKNQNAYYIDLTRTNDQILSSGIKYNDLNFYK